MCMSQFRDYCKAYRFVPLGSMTKTEIKTGYPPCVAKHERSDGTTGYETRLYVTDMAKMEKLADEGNVYAIETIKKGV